MGQYCFARWHLLSSSVVICNTAGGRAGSVTDDELKLYVKLLLGTRADDTPRRASSVTSC